jgi:hypothetical protein
LAVGYPHIIGGSGTCLGLTPSDASFLSEPPDKVNAAISASANQAGTSFVDTSQAFEHRELCSANPDVVLPGSFSLNIGYHDWIHPNLNGQLTIAAIVAKFIARTIWNETPSMGATGE